jgi:predicted nucleic acid-binding protein
VTSYLIDKSAWARAGQPSVRAVLERLVETGRMATCAITNLEILYSARSSTDYANLSDELAGLNELPVESDQLARALGVQRALAARGQHRLPIPDLIIAAAAESAGHTILHYDADYERIADITGQAHEWIAPRGTIS